MLQKFIVVSLLSVWSLQTVAKDLAITLMTRQGLRMATSMANRDHKS